MSDLIITIGFVVFGCAHLAHAVFLRYLARGQRELTTECIKIVREMRKIQERVRQLETQSRGHG